jgi:HEPN domain-containing protein
MTSNKRTTTIEGWIDKASNQLQAAREHSKFPTQYSETIQAAQECVELSVKSILSLLNVTFPPSHGWEQDITLAIIKVTSGYKFQTAAYRTDFS